MIVQVENKSFRIPENYNYTENITGCKKEGSVEKKELETFISATENCKCLFDIGSALGIFSLLFADGVRESFAFEPSHIQQPHYTQIYLANRDKKIYPQKMMVGEKTGIVKFHSEDFHALAGNGNDRILMMTIDDFCGMTETRPDVIKVDVEGYEIKVLEGANEVIRVLRPILFIEAHNKFLTYYNNTVEEMAAYPQMINYRVFGLDGKELTSEEYLSMLRENRDFTHTYWIPNP